MPAHRHRRVRAFAAGLLGAGLIAATATAAGPLTYTIAGNGTPPEFTGDSLSASSSTLNNPRGMAFSPTGVLVADTDNHRVREIRWDGTMVTVAGTGVPGRLGDGAAATLAQLNEPAAVTSTPDGGLLIADRGNGLIRRVGTDGVITTVAGRDSDVGQEGHDNASKPGVGHDGPKPKPKPKPKPGIGNDDGDDEESPEVGNDDGDDEGSPEVGNDDGDDEESPDVGNDDGADDEDHGPDIQYPQDVALTADGGFLVADSQQDEILSVDSEGDVRRLAGTGVSGFNGDGGSALEAQLDDPRGVVATPDGGMLIADTGNHRVRRVDPDGRISTVAGNGADGFAGDGGPAADAQLRSPVRLTLIPEGGYLIADPDDNRVRVVSSSGIIWTAAGTGEPGYNGEALAPAETQLNRPWGVLAFGNGSILVADSSNHRLRLVSQPGEPSARVMREPTLPPPAPPVAGKQLNVTAERGEVFVKVPGADRYVELDGAASVPVGSLIDAEGGAVRLTSAADLKGAKQTAIFSRGVFAVLQKRQRQPVTDLVLKGGDFSSCKRRTSAPKRRTSTRHSAVVNASRRGARRGLWGRGHGRFRTRGRHGAATVRGTIWFTQDRCDGTLVRVKRGVVSVNDFTRKRQVLVPAGGSYLAPSRQAG